MLMEVKKEKTDKENQQLKEALVFTKAEVGLYFLYKG